MGDYRVTQPGKEELSARLADLGQDPRFFLE